MQQTLLVLSMRDMTDLLKENSGSVPSIPHADADRHIHQKHGKACCNAPRHDKHLHMLTDMKSCRTAESAC